MKEWSSSSCLSLWSAFCRVVDLLNRTDPISVSLDEVKADHILSLTNNMLLLISSQTPIMKKLIESCQFTHHIYSIHIHNMASLIC